MGLARTRQCPGWGFAYLSPWFIAWDEGEGGASVCSRGSLAKEANVLACHTLCGVHGRPATSPLLLDTGEALQQLAGEDVDDSDPTRRIALGAPLSVRRRQNSSARSDRFPGELAGKAPDDKHRWRPPKGSTCFMLPGNRGMLSPFRSRPCVLRGAGRCGTTAEAAADTVTGAIRLSTGGRAT